jgi:DNA-binding transcriptional MocR family regulator
VRADRAIDPNISRWIAQEKWFAHRLGLSRNTVQARLTRLDERGALDSFGRRINPAALGYPLHAFVTTQVEQRGPDAAGAAPSEADSPPLAGWPARRRYPAWPRAPP